MPKTYNPDTEIPDLSGKVIVVTGGTQHNPSSYMSLRGRNSPSTRTVFNQKENS
jgi:hypothetical protein